MPIKNNAKKALRQAAKRAKRNLIVKRTYKAALKSVRKAVESGEGDVQELLRLAQKALDKASKRGVLKKNTAARLLSRLHAHVQRAGMKTEEEAPKKKTTKKPAAKKASTKKKTTTKKKAAKKAE
jgi:small subunit ribosomal protein S20